MHDVPIEKLLNSSIINSREICSNSQHQQLAVECLPMLQKLVYFYLHKPCIKRFVPPEGHSSASQIKDQEITIWSIGGEILKLLVKLRFSYIQKLLAVISL